MCSLAREQYPGASQQNIANYFSLLWGKPIGRHCGGDKKKNGTRHVKVRNG
jgi:hypothetical protein